MPAHQELKIVVGHTWRETPSLRERLGEWLHQAAATIDHRPWMTMCASIEGPQQAQIGRAELIEAIQQATQGLGQRLADNVGHLAQAAVIEALIQEMERHDRTDPSQPRPRSQWPALGAHPGPAPALDGPKQHKRHSFTDACARAFQRLVSAAQGQRLSSLQG